MADVPYGGPTPVQQARDGRSNAVQTLGTMTNWAGAAISLALIVGIGVWSYKTLSRDVSGVPVVRAASGEPMRVQPDDPGGSPALHQGLSVNGVAALGAAEKPADRLILAPPPVSLADEDIPSQQVTLAAAPQPLKPKTTVPTSFRPVRRLWTRSRPRQRRRRKPCNLLPPWCLRKRPSPWRKPPYPRKKR